MRVLITGFAGFIGSNLTRLILERHPEWDVVGVDAYTYASAPDWVFEFKPSDEKPRNFRATRLDLTNSAELLRLVEEFKPQAVLHLAAETHVCNSIAGPGAFVQANIVGTFNLLEACRRVWAGDKAPVFLHVSTDEVFGELRLEDPPFHVEHPIRPRSPYAATKAASDHLVMAYHHTYGMNTRVTNCTNNFGPNQHAEKLIPRVIERFLQEKPMTVYGPGSQVRDWLWVFEHAEALLKVLERGAAGGRYLIGGNNERSNLSVIQSVVAACNRVFSSMERSVELVFTKDRPSDDYRYAVDISSTRALGWAPRPELFEERLEQTVAWYEREGLLKGLLPPK